MGWVGRDSQHRVMIAARATACCAQSVMPSWRRDTSTRGISSTIFTPQRAGARGGGGGEGRKEEAFPASSKSSEEVALDLDSPPAIFHCPAGGAQSWHTRPSCCSRDRGCVVVVLLLLLLLEGTGLVKGGRNSSASSTLLLTGHSNMGSAVAHHTMSNVKVRFMWER